jgi:hypothetical protein
MRTPSTQTTVAVLLVAVLAIAGASAGALAADPSIDTETSETSQESDITDGGTQTYNASTSSNLSWIADSDSSKVKIEQNNRTLYTATPANYSYNSSSGDHHYNVSLADDGADYDGLEVGADADVTLNTTLTNNTSASSPNTTEISHTFANGDEAAFVVADDDETEIGDSDGVLNSLTSLGSDDEADPAQSEDETTIHGENTSTIHIDSGDDEMTDALDDVTSADTDGITWDMQVAADGQNLIVITEDGDVPEFVDEDEDAYAVLEDDGDLRIENANDLSDEDGTEDVDVTVRANEATGLWASQSILRSYDAGLVTAATAADGPDWNGDAGLAEV